jgi:hypothetical protein
VAPVMEAKGSCEMSMEKLEPRLSLLPPLLFSSKTQWKLARVLRPVAGSSVPAISLSGTLLTLNEDELVWR